jgi:GNAT superfamily N-acetyltransferase
MIQYKRCSKVSQDMVYHAFKIGFSDYMIKMELSMEEFIKRFFGPEGNALYNSFIAVEGEKPVGLILGGIKVYEGVKTIRCGTLCIHPEYRGIGVAQALFELYKQEGIDKGCKQLFLEVIVGNDRAIRFYEKVGFEKIYDLKYFSLSSFDRLEKHSSKEIEVKQISAEEFEENMSEAENIHINWQNDLDFIRKSEGQIFFGAVERDKVIASTCISKGGKLSVLWVNRKNRMQGIAAAILKQASKELGLVRISSAIPNNALLEGFYRHIGFDRDKVSQYEMYLPL